MKAVRRFVKHFLPLSREVEKLRFVFASQNIFATNARIKHEWFIARKFKSIRIQLFNNVQQPSTLNFQP